MDYEGDVQGILKRKDASIWQAYSFLLVKDRLLVFDIDKVNGKIVVLLLILKLLIRFFFSN